MSRLEEINDVKTLQQVASHLEKTTVRQSKLIANLRTQIARLKGEDIDPQMEIELLREQLAAMQRMAFSESSERKPSDKKTGDEESQEPRRGHGPKSQPNLPVEEVTHTLEEKERSCSICGEVLTELVPGTQLYNCPVPPSVNCATVYPAPIVRSCSLGQISSALYEVGGQYRRSM